MTKRTKLVTMECYSLGKHNGQNPEAPDAILKSFLI